MNLPSWLGRILTMGRTRDDLALEGSPAPGAVGLPEHDVGVDVRFGVGADVRTGRRRCRFTTGKQLQHRRCCSGKFGEAMRADQDTVWATIWVQPLVPEKLPL